MNPATHGHAILINGIQAAGKTTVAELIGRRAPTFRVIDGDEIIRAAPDVPLHQVQAQAARLFAETLETIAEALDDTNVVFAGAWTEKQVREAQARFGDAGLFAVLRIDERERARRQRRRSRQLAHEFQEGWHDLPGPDELYDLALDSMRLNRSTLAHRIMEKAEWRWPELAERGQWRNDTRG